MNFDIIREQTRLSLPADDFYLYRLGVALYGFASITSFMIEIICRLVPKEPLNNAPQIRDTTRLMLRGDPCN
ncbi:hypothetical protein ABFU50_12990 [Xanthomonas campestris pv. campestris]|uniref:hypothetical protein n=1 Tax=Xanthomonas campestris TaxID=339 RepID=UPI0020C96773|nr:hypothetical protein [Xanthomonas campestris]MEA9598096.1 hypothetical protein [Xanthomonas campestris]